MRIVVTAVALAAVSASVGVGVELGAGGSSESTAGQSRTGVVELTGHSSVAGPALDAAPHGDGR